MTTQLLESILGLKFNNPQLLQQALVHRSYVNERGWAVSDSYERLEFLGDAVLELVISTELYRRLPELSEGELTKSRSALVCRESLAHVASEIGLGNFLSLGKGEESTGGRERDSNLSAVLESVVAAIYLDQGTEAAQSFILRVMKVRLDDASLHRLPLENPKSHLQEYVQGLGHPTPTYRVVSSEGPDHGPVFTVEALVDDTVVGTGQGRRKTDAEGAAARDALEKFATAPRE